MALPTITTFTASTTISSSEVNTNLANLRNRSDINPSSGHVVLTPGSNSVVKYGALRQDDTTNAYETSVITFYGWGFIQGVSSSTVNEGVTIGITCDDRVVPIVSGLGYKDGSDPTHIADSSGFNGSEFCVAYQPSTSGFTVYFIHKEAGGNLNAAYRYLYSWIALGEDA